MKKYLMVLILLFTIKVSALENNDFVIIYNHNSKEISSVYIDEEEKGVVIADLENNCVINKFSSSLFKNIEIKDSKIIAYIKYEEIASFENEIIITNNDFYEASLINIRCDTNEGINTSLNATIISKEKLENVLDVKQQEEEKEVKEVRKVHPAFLSLGILLWVGILFFLTRKTDKKFNA